MCELIGSDSFRYRTAALLLLEPAGSCAPDLGSAAGGYL